MATVTEMREWLKANTDQDIPDRGRLRPDLVHTYEAAHAGLDGDPWPSDDDLEDVAGPAVPAAEEPEAAEVRPEVRPSRKRVRQAPSARASGMLGKLLTGGDSKDKTPPKGRPKPKPRVSLEKMTGRLYSAASNILKVISPAAATCMSIQGPMAGVVFEDTFKNTVVDRVLQPVARVEGAIEIVEGFALPPIACMAIEMTYAMEQTPAVMFRRGVAFQMLREGLRTSLEITEKYADQIAEARERSARSDAEVDRLISLIFPPPVVEDVPDQEMAGAAA